MCNPTQVCICPFLWLCSLACAHLLVLFAYCLSAFARRNPLCLLVISLCPLVISLGQLMISLCWLHFTIGIDPLLIAFSRLPLRSLSIICGLVPSGCALVPVMLVSVPTTLTLLPIKPALQGRPCASQLCLSCPVISSLWDAPPLWILHQGQCVRAIT